MVDRLRTSIEEIHEGDGSPEVYGMEKGRKSEER